MLKEELFGIVKGGNSTLPSLGIHLDVRIVDGFCEMLVKHYLVNNSDNPLECTFEILKSNKIFLREVSVEKDNKVYYGKVLEKEDAGNKYDDSIARYYNNIFSLNLQGKFGFSG